MATINTHAMFTPGSTSATGSLTCGAGDLVIVAVNVSTSIALGSVSGGGLNWTNVIDNTASQSHMWIFTAVSPTALSAQTITVTATGSSLCAGSLIAATNASKVKNFNNASSLGGSSVSNTLTTGGSNSLVLALFSASDCVYTAPSSALDNDGTRFSGTAGSTYGIGTSVTVAATSAGGNLGIHFIYEVTSSVAQFNNTGLRPYSFSPGLAR